MMEGREDLGRYTEAPQFVYSAGGQEPTQEDAAKVAKEIAGEAAGEEGLEIRGVPSSVGRGASGAGIALQVLGIIADVGGSVAAIVVSAKAVARFWKRLFRTKGPPMLSLGAIKLLCIADLAQRETTLEGIELLHAIDVTGVIADIDHTGLDLFLITFVRPLPGYQGEGDLWFYVVDTYGQVIHRATSRFEALYRSRAFDWQGWTRASPAPELAEFLCDPRDEGQDD